MGVPQFLLELTRAYMFKFAQAVASFSFVHRCGKKMFAALSELTELLCHVHRHMLPSVRHVC